MGKVFDLSKFKSTQPEKPAEPATRKGQRRATKPFVMVPLEWIERAARLIRSPQTLVLMALLYASWRARGAAFPLPSGWLKQLGVSRNLQRRILLDLECGRLITVQRSPRKAPIITLNTEA